VNGFKTLFRRTVDYRIAAISPVGGTRTGIRWHKPCVPRQLHIAMVRLHLSVALIACCTAIAACASGSTSVLGPSDTRCALALTVNSSTLPAEGGKGTLTITTARECQWSASTTGSWLSFTTPATGQGPGAVSFEVLPNRSLQARTANLVVSEQHVNLSQSAATCSIAVTPASIAVGPEGGEARLHIAADDFCSWTASSQSAWLSFGSDPNGTGSSELVLNVAPNSGGQRAGTINVAGTQVNISQREAAPTCQVAVSPTSGSTPASGGTLTVEVTAGPTCSWNVGSPASWITAAPAGGTGSGTVIVSTSPNGGAARSGVLTIGGESFTVTQLAASSVPCTFAVAPLRFDDVPAATSSVDVNVTTGTECAWIASSNANWITVLDGGSGMGNGTARLSVLQNSGASRSGTVTVAGQTVTVNQAAASTCSYTIDPVSFTNVQAAGASTSVAVTTTAGCAWTVTGNPSWVSATPASSTGSGTVLVTVQPNTGSARTATFKIADKDFNVAQLAAPSCTYTVSPDSIQVSSDNQSQTILVTTQTNCAVAATVDVQWIDITSVGVAPNATVALAIDRNTGKTDRTGTVTITGQNFSQAVQILQRGRD
jgi:hypothetical protein